MRLLKVVTTSLMAVCLMAVIASGQSGRKLPTWSDPKPSPSPTPSDDQKQAKDKNPLTTLIVTQYVMMVGSSYYTNVAIETCLARLKASAAATINHERDMTRKDATERAKKETAAYVVWLEMDTDSMNTGMGGGNPYRLFLTYAVFTPGTAKIKTQGRIYQSNVGSSSGPMGAPTGGGPDYRLALVGPEAADRILFSLGLPIPHR
jgi:hypothetical protein